MRKIEQFLCAARSDIAILSDSETELDAQSGTHSVHQMSSGLTASIADGETYGTHLLVDNKPIDDADELLTECEQYIDDTKSELFTLPFASFSRVAANIKAWRVKRKDSRMLTSYHQLQPRLAVAEKNLRAVIGDVVEKKGVLRLQARSLQARLESCVEHNKKLLHLSNEPLEVTRTFVNTLSSESTLLKESLTFNTEVLRLKKLEDHARSAAVLRWGKQRQVNKQVPEPDLAKDDDHNALEARLLTLRDLREKFVSYLAYILEKRGIQQSNLDNCLWSLDAIKVAVKREGVNHEEEVEDRASVFDHCRCTDCAFGYSMACDCMSHFQALQKQAQEANRRLLSLVEVRERMLEAAENMAKSQNEEFNGAAPPSPDKADPQS